MIVNGGYHQQAGLSANHRGSQGWVRAYNVSLQTPGDRERFVSLLDNTGKLSELSLIDRLLPK